MIFFDSGNRSVRLTQPFKTEPLQPLTLQTAHGPSSGSSQMPVDFGHSSLQEAFAQQRPDLVGKEKSSTGESSTVFNVVEAISTPPSLTKEMCSIVSKSIVFCRANDLNQVTQCVQAVVEEHDCFRISDTDTLSGLSRPEESVWVWNLVHYSRSKFSIDINVTFWTLDDHDSVCTSFRACPRDANFAVEFQRLGGDSFAWMDLWADMLSSIQMNSRGGIQFTRNADPVKRRCLDVDLLSDSEDDCADDGVISSLNMLMSMYRNNSLEGQLEALKTLCRMSENLGYMKQMASEDSFISFVGEMLQGAYDACRETIRPAPLLRCAISIVLSAVGTEGGKKIVAADEVMRIVSSLVEDSNMCPAVRCECASTVLYMLSHGINFAAKDTVLEAVDAAVDDSNGKKLKGLLSQVQSKVRSLSYR